MANESGKKARSTGRSGDGVERRGLLRLGTLITALTGASAISAFGAGVAKAAPGDKNAPNNYVPVAEKGAASGVATLDIESKIPIAQVPDLSAIYDRKGEVVIRPESFGAQGDGVADDTGPVRHAFEAANALARTGLLKTIQHPGASVLLTGTYNLASLTAPIDIKCNVDNNRASFLVPASYAGVSVRVGHPDAGGYFQTANIHLPDVVKPTNSAIVAGSVGVRLQNLGNSVLAFGRTYYHETGIHLTGNNQGTVYNSITLGHISYCKVSIKIKPDMPGGWVNQNTFTGGGVQQSVGYAGGIRQPGWRHLVIDGNGINAVDMNIFTGTSFEGDVSEYAFEIRQATFNQFRGCRFEQGTRGVATTVSGATLTTVGHSLAVGDMVTFSATTVPGGMFLSTGYYVASVPTPDTFSVSLKKGGTAVAFTTAGAAVVYFRPPRILIDSTGSLTSNNTGEGFFAVQGVVEVVDTVGAGAGNVFQPAGTRVADNYVMSDAPPYRGRNKYSSAVSRPIFAAYPPSQKPTENPNGWTAAVSDRGLLFAANEAETGVLGNLGGALTYKRPTDATTFQIPSAARTPGLITISSLICAPATTTAFTFTLTGASVNDHVLPTLLSHVAGISVSHAYVSATNTVTVVFANLTPAQITINANLQAVAFRRYY